MNKKPDFLIVGAMKCATSTLHDQLSLQPGIFMTELKEPNFFSNDEQYCKGLDWYLSHFRLLETQTFVESPVLTIQNCRHILIQ